jgi:hypothetical protein
VIYATLPFAGSPDEVEGFFRDLEKERVRTHASRRAVVRPWRRMMSAIAGHFNVSSEWSPTSQPHPRRQSDPT